MYVCMYCPNSWKDQCLTYILLGYSFLQIDINKLISDYASISVYIPCAIEPVRELNSINLEPKALFVKDGWWMMARNIFLLIYEWMDEKLFMNESTFEKEWCGHIRTLKMVWLSVKLGVLINLENWLDEI